MYRRHFIGSLGAASLSLGCGAGLPRGRDPASLAEALRRVERGDLLDLVARRASDGATAADFMGAALVAGAKDIQPDPVGFDLHTVMMVASNHRLGADASSAERWLPVLYNLDDYKIRQASQTGWSLGPAPKVGAAKDRQKLVNALETWDAEAADRALTTLHGALGARAIFELLWPYAGRDFSDLGHRIIYAAQTWRAIWMVPWPDALPPLRSLVAALCLKGPAEAIAPFAHNRARLVRFPEGWQQGKDAPAFTRDLHRRLCTASPDEAPEACLEVLRSGASARTVWDALRLFAGELLSLQPSIVAVHAATTVNAFAIAYEATREERSRRLLLLQASAWVVLFRDLAQLKPTGALLGLTPATGSPPPRAVLEVLPRDLEAAQRLCLAQSDLRPLIGLIRKTLFRRSAAWHDYKYASAVFDDLPRTHPHWRRHLLAAGLRFHPKVFGDEAPGYGARRALSERLSLAFGARPSQ